MVVRRLTNRIKDAKKYIFLTVVFNTVSLFANIASIFTIARFLDNLLQGSLANEMIIRTALVILAVISIRAVANFLSARTSYLSSAKVKQLLRADLFKKLLRLGISYNEKVATSEAVQLAVEGIEQLEIFFGAYLPQLIYSLLAPISLFIVLSFVSLKSALILLLCVPLIPLSIIAFQKIAKRLLGRYWGSYTSLADSFLENIQGLTTLKIFESDSKKSAEMDEEAEKFRKITMKVLTMQLNSITVMDLIAFGGAAIGVIVAVNEYFNGSIGFAGVFAIIMLSAEFFIPLRILGSFFHIAMNGIAASEKLFRILDLNEREAGSETIAAEDISFSDLNFSYEESRLILKDINFRIARGEFVSFVGESGSGKSTIAALIMGIYKNYQGSIQIGSKEIGNLAEDSIMANITMVNHNSYIFKGTIQDNLLLGNAAASKEEMDQVLKKVNLYDFVYEEKGLATKIVEKGSNLSGGQRQRLALARALLHDTPIYIFDEATSNIDAESEALIMGIIEELAATKTIILISHKMGNVVNADRIYVLEKGRLVQEGSHLELIEEAGQYRKIYTEQSNLENYAKVKEELVYA